MLHHHLAFLGDRRPRCFSPASPRIISLWARPDGIIGKQFSFWIDHAVEDHRLASTLIISLIAASRSPGFSQRMPTA